MATVLVTAVGRPAGFNLARSLLADRGFHPVGTEAEPYLGRFARLGFPIETVPDADDPGYLAALLDVVVQYGASVVLPASDGEVAALAPHAARLAAAGAVLLAPGPGPVALCGEGGPALRVAASVGVPVARDLAGTGLPGGAPGLSGEPLAGVGAPEGPVALLRAPAARTGGACAPPGPRRERAQPVAEPGLVHSVAVLYDTAHRLRASMVVGTFAARSRGGCALSAGETVDREDLRTLGIRAVEAVGPWTGLAAAEFAPAWDGGPAVLRRIRPRAFSFGWLAASAGVNFAALAARAALGDDFPEVRRYRVGVSFVRMADDRIAEPDGLPPGRLAPGAADVRQRHAGAGLSRAQDAVRPTRPHGEEGGADVAIRGAPAGERQAGAKRGAAGVPAGGGAPVPTALRHGPTPAGTRGPQTDPGDPRRG